MEKLIPFFIAVIFLISCEKEHSAELKEDSTNNVINDFHDKNREDQELFSIDHAGSNTVSASGGATIHLPASGFITEDGSAVTGKINVSVKEIYGPGEMILNDMPTTAGGRLLESGGEFLVKVFQNSKPLKLAPGKFIRIAIPNKGKNLQAMQVFKGVPDADGNVNWAVNNNPGNFVVGDSTLFSKADLFSDDINRINCDKFINDPTVEFTVFPGNAPSGDSTNVFVHLTGRNTVVKMNWTRGLQYFKSNMLLAVPSTIVGISVKNGKLFASIMAVSIQNGGSVTMNLTPFTEDQLKSRLSQLR